MNFAQFRNTRVAVENLHPYTGLEAHREKPGFLFWGTKFLAQGEYSGVSHHGKPEPIKELEAIAVLFVELLASKVGLLSAAGQAAFLAIVQERGVLEVAKSITRIVDSGPIAPAAGNHHYAKSWGWLTGDVQEELENLRWPAAVASPAPVAPAAPADRDRFSEFRPHD